MNVNKCHLSDNIVNYFHFIGKINKDIILFTMIPALNYNAYMDFDLVKSTIFHNIPK